MFGLLRCGWVDERGVAGLEQLGRCKGWMSKVSTDRCANVGINVKMLLHATAALAAAPGDLHVPETLFAIVGNCHVFAFCWTILDWPYRALGAVVSWICDIGAALQWSVPGACKKPSSAFSKEKGYDSLPQASTQVLTPRGSW